MGEEGRGECRVWKGGCDYDLAMDFVKDIEDSHLVTPNSRRIKVMVSMAVHLGDKTLGGLYDQVNPNLVELFPIYMDPCCPAFRAFVTVTPEPTFFPNNIEGQRGCFRGTSEDMQYFGSVFLSKKRCPIHSKRARTPMLIQYVPCKLCRNQIAVNTPLKLTT